MKTRALKPVYWKDAALATWTPAQREFYMGCWMLADDAGIMRVDVWEIGAELYPYRAPKAREATVVKLLAHVVAAGKVLVLDCQRHAAVPAVTQNLLSGNKAYHIQAEHQHRCITG